MKMLRARITKAAGLAALIVGASLAVAAPANAGYYLSQIPTVQNFATTYCENSGRMLPQFNVDGANLDLYRVETQRIYVQLGVYSRATGLIADRTYYYGVSTGMDVSTAEYLDHVQTWYDAYTGQGTSAGFLGIYNRGYGTWQVAVRFAWDRSSSGALSSSSLITGGWTGWKYLWGLCTY
jgi:hypothetical protein